MSDFVSSRTAHIGRKCVARYIVTLAADFLLQITRERESSCGLPLSILCQSQALKRSSLLVKCHVMITVAWLLVQTGEKRMKPGDDSRETESVIKRFLLRWSSFSCPFLEQSSLHADKRSKRNNIFISKRSDTNVFTAIKATYQEAPSSFQPGEHHISYEKCGRLLFLCHVKERQTSSDLARRMDAPRTQCTRLNVKVDLCVSGLLSWLLSCLHSACSMKQTVA